MKWSLEAYFILETLYLSRFWPKHDTGCVNGYNYSQNKIDTRCAKKVQFKHELVEYNVFLFDEELFVKLFLFFFLIRITL
jgi:hypothetical protein